MQSFVADVDVCSNSLMVYAMLMERKMDLLFLKSYATIGEKRGIVSKMRLGSCRATNSRLICRGNQVIPGNHRFQGITDSQIFERELP